MAVPSTLTVTRGGWIQLYFYLLVAVTSLLAGVQCRARRSDPVWGREPDFDVPEINVTITAGMTAVLPCSINFLEDHKVIWLGPRATLLTLENTRIIDDDRISINRPYRKEWNLHIRDVYYEDQGEYTCQINTDPVKNKEVYLHVQAKSCGSPGEPINGQRTGSVFTVGSQVSFSCDDGYELVGDQWRTCLANSQWTGSVPVCNTTTTPESVTTEVPGSNKTRNDIECGSDYIRLSIPATLLHPGRTARLRDPSCTVTVSGGKVTAQFNLRECGTMAHFTDRYIVYKNELTVDSSLADPSTSDFSIPIECSYPRSNTLTLSYMPVHRKVKVYEKNFGSLDISMKQYYSNNFANLYDDSAYPVDMELTKNVYMSIGVNHPESSKLAMFPMMCLANGSPSPWGSTLSHELIKDGCKEDQSVVMYPGDNPAEVRFSFNAFQFSQRIGPVYVHCDVLLCRASNTSSRCAAGCLSQSARRKRSAVEVSSLHDGHFVSGGPFHFNSRPDGKVPALVFVAGVVAAVSMLVAIVAVSVAGITLRLRTQRMVESGDFRK